MARIVALLVVAALAATPAAASAAAAAQQPSLLQDTVPQQAPAPVQQAPTTPQTEANSGALSGDELVLIGFGILVLIGGIWVVIARDARRATAGRVRTGEGELAGRGGSATRAARRSRKLSAEERRRRKRGRAR